LENFLTHAFAYSSNGVRLSSQKLGEEE